MNKLDDELKYPANQRKDIVIAFISSENEGCVSMLPKLQVLADTVEKRTIIYLVDVEKKPGMAEEYQIAVEKLPAFLFYRDGKEIDKLVEPKFEELDDGVLELSGLQPAKDEPEVKGKPDEQPNPEVDQGSPPRD